MSLPLNQVIHGDCLEVMPSIPDKSIDMILCDLPYGTTACKWDTAIPFEPLWKEYKRLIKDNGAVVLFGSEPFSSYLRMSNITNYKYDLVWDKVQGSSFALANKQPLRKHENIILFSYGVINYYPQMVLKEKPLDDRNWKGDGNGENARFGSKVKTKYIRTHSYPGSIIRVNSTSKECNPPQKIHPTQKPVALFEYLIKTYTNEGETVLDNCIGSGTTAIACINTGRNFIGIEKEREYVDIARKRISEHSNQMDLGVTQC